MPRMREAMRSGWKSSIASSFSPTPSSLIGQPVTARIDSAAPPRASPSTRVSMIPVSPTLSWKLAATVTASWPVMASATSRVSWGLAASRTAAASAIISSSTARRPAVSSSTTSKPSSAPVCIARLAIATGGSPGTISSVRTFACNPSTLSCSCAAGRRTSSEAISTFFLDRWVRRRPILAQLVVLPEPCRPTSMIATGGGASRSSGTASVPSISIRWSWTTLMTICPGAIERRTCAPIAFSLTVSTKSLTTGSATSASSSAIRTSRSAAVTSASLSAPRRVSWPRTSPRRSCKLSNMAGLARPQIHRSRQTEIAPVRETRGLAGLPGATRVAGDLPMAAVAAEHRDPPAPGQAGLLRP